MQLDLIPTEPEAAPLTLRDISHGIPVKLVSSSKIVMKVKPTGFLLNSSIVSDVLNRGDCFIVDLAKGTLYAVQSDRPVTKLNKAKLHYTI